MIFRCASSDVEHGVGGCVARGHVTDTMSFQTCLFDKASCKIACRIFKKTAGTWVVGLVGTHLLEHIDLALIKPSLYLKNTFKSDLGDISCSVAVFNITEKTVFISEIDKKSSLAAALLAAIPLLSILAMTWMYVDTKDNNTAVEFSNRIVWLITPSMTLFIAFPILIKRGFSFYPSMFISILMTIFACYSIIFLIDKLGIRS